MFFLGKNVVKNSGKLEPTAQGRDSTFTFCHALLKRAIFTPIKGQRCQDFSVSV